MFHKPTGKSLVKTCACEKHTCCDDNNIVPLEKRNRFATSMQYLSDAAEAHTLACIILSTGTAESSGRKLILNGPVLMRFLVTVMQSLGQPRQNKHKYSLSKIKGKSSGQKSLKQYTQTNNIMFLDSIC